MSKIHQRKNVPVIVRQWFEVNLPNCEYSFYSYQGINGLTFGCNVFKDGGFYANAYQGTEQDFAKM